MPTPLPLVLSFFPVRWIVDVCSSLLTCWGRNEDEEEEATFTLAAAEEEDAMREKGGEFVGNVEEVMDATSTTASESGRRRRPPLFVNPDRGGGGGGTTCCSRRGTITSFCLRLRVKAFLLASFFRMPLPWHCSASAVVTLEQTSLSP